MVLDGTGLFLKKAKFNVGFFWPTKSLVSSIKAENASRMAGILIP